MFWVLKEETELRQDMSRPRSLLNTKTGVLDVRVSHAEELDGVVKDRFVDFSKAAGRAVSKAGAAAMRMTRSSAQEMCHQIEHKIEGAIRMATSIKVASSTERFVYNDPNFPSVEWIRGDQHFLARPAYKDDSSVTKSSIRWGEIVTSDDPGEFPFAAVKASELIPFDQFIPVNIGKDPVGAAPAAPAAVDPNEPLPPEFKSRVPLPRSSQPIAGRLWHPAEMDLRQCSENVLRATRH